jgi:hypothetical protein
MSFFVRMLDMVRRKEPLAELDAERAEIGLKLSDLDGDEHTTEVLSERLGIRMRLSDPRTDAA